MQDESSLDENKLRRLIGRLDVHIDANGLEIMKLSMRCELSQDERDNVANASSLCYRLLEQYDRPVDFLSRLIYALEILGHRRHGYRAVRQIEKVYKPPPFDTNNLHSRVNKEKFLLHQCLAVACRLIPRSSNRSFTAHYAEELGHNPNNYTTPCSIITQLLEQGKVTVDNYEDFVEEALIEADFSDTQLKDYHDICNRISKFKINYLTQYSTLSPPPLHESYTIRYPIYYMVLMYTENNQSQRSRSSTHTADGFLMVSTSKETTIVNVYLGDNSTKLITV